MWPSCLGFFIGVLLTQHLPVLPPWYALLMTVWLAAAGEWWSLRRWRRVSGALGLALGLCWASFSAQQQLAQRPPLDLIGQDVLLSGRIVGLPRLEEGRQRFDLRVEQAANWPNASGAKLRLSWYRPQQTLRSGEHWQLRVRLKPPTGLHNPGGFDYETHLYRQGIAARGYVRDPQQARRLNDTPLAALLGRLMGWRQQLRDRLLDGAPAAGRAVIAALVVGDRSGLPDDYRDALVGSGTMHLFAISGLHVGLVALLGGWLFGRLWRLSARLCLWQPVPRVRAAAAIGLALVYAALAGFSVPTLRALVMLLVVLGAQLFDRQVQPLRQLALALVAVLLIDPLALLSAGFWLSFSAVAALLLVFAGRVQQPGRWRGLWQMQWLLALVLLPVLVGWQMPVSALAPLANLVLVPLFGFVVVPAALLGTLLLAVPLVGAGWLDGLAAALAWLMEGLAWLTDTLPATFTLPPPSAGALALAAVGVVLVLLPRGLPGRAAGLLLLAPLLLLRPQSPAAGDLQLTLLDVGQGLSLVFRTQRHVLVYDLGPGHRYAVDATRHVVLPFLRAGGIERVDRLVISHGDADHAGRAAWLLGQLPVGQVISGEPQALPGVRASRCDRPQHWRWDGVDFALLNSPGIETDGRSNNRSCILLAGNAAGRVLIGGDMEADAEAELVRRYAEQLRALAVVLPHHGSRTSSSAALVAATRPRYALVSSGFRNRYRLPNAKVMARWRAAGAEPVNTAEAGAIELRLAADGSYVPPSGWRDRHRHYWYWPRKPGP